MSLKSGIELERVLNSFKTTFVKEAGLQVKSMVDSFAKARLEVDAIANRILPAGGDDGSTR